MATREVLSIGHPALREVAQPVPAADVTSAETQGLIDDLIATMRHANGAGGERQFQFAAVEGDRLGSPVGQ